MIVVAALAAACAMPAQGLRPLALPADPAAATSFTFAAPDGTELAARFWRPASEPRAVLVVMHGLKDHAGRYEAFARRLNDAGVAVYAFDLRGHGRSAGRRVAVGTFDDYVDDLAAFVARVREREPGRPIFLLGHSMGGAIAARYTVDHMPRLGGLILSAAALRLDVWPFTLAATKMSAAFTPGLRGLDLPNQDFSSDPAVVAEMSRDELIYQGKGPLHTAAALVDGIAVIWDRLDRLRVPLLVLHGTADKLTSVYGSHELWAGATGTKDRTLRVYQGLWHDLLHERGADVGGDVIAWIDERIAGPVYGVRHKGAPVGPAPAKPAATFMVGVSHEVPLDGEVADLAGARLDGQLGLGHLVLAGDLLLGGADGFAWSADAKVGFGLARGRGVFALTGDVGGDGFGGETHFRGGFGLRGEVQLTRFVRLVSRMQLHARFGEPARAPSERGDVLIYALPEQRGELGVRLGCHSRYWGTAFAGYGLYIGLTGRIHSGNEYLGVTVGWHLAGGE